MNGKTAEETDRYHDKSERSRQIDKARRQERDRWRDGRWGWRRVRKEVETRVS